jgi:ubiquinone/menaquinone biosynthesis C-methylase UbiE
MMESRLQFFDRIAHEWDGGVDLETMARKLKQGLVEFDIPPSAHVVDLGCGTGNLVLALLAHLNGEASIHAVDFSKEMIAKARTKTNDPRVHWTCSDAAALPFEDRSKDFVLCYCAWPHFPEPDKVLSEVRRVLRPAGTFIVWHDISRKTVNTIHEEAGPAVCSDLLEPVSRLAYRLETSGFTVLRQVDDDDRYLVIARCLEF